MTSDGFTTATAMDTRTNINALANMIASVDARSTCRLSGALLT